MTSIGGSAFSGCRGLTSITIPDGVTSIEDMAFNGCIGLTSITIPSSVTSIGSGAFSDCSSLTEIIVNITNEEYKDINGVFFSKDEKTLICYPAGKKETSYEIPSSVVSILDDAFSDCSSLTSITIPDGVTNIEPHAFYGCSKLTSITIPDGVTNIKFDAFYDCSNLATVNYAGTEGQWLFIEIGGGNQYLTNATINYEYKLQP